VAAADGKGALRGGGGAVALWAAEVPEEKSIYFYDATKNFTAWAIRVIQYTRILNITMNEYMSVKRRENNTTYA